MMWLRFSGANPNRNRIFGRARRSCNPNGPLIRAGPISKKNRAGPVADSPVQAVFIKRKTFPVTELGGGVQFSSRSCKLPVLILELALYVHIQSLYGILHILTNWTQLSGPLC